MAEDNNGDEADYIEAGSAACGAILQMAIEKAGTVEPVKVRDAIAATDAETFYGHVKFTAGGQINSLQPPVFQLVGGKPVDPLARRHQVGRYPLHAEVISACVLRRSR